MATVIVLLWILQKLNAPLWCYIVLVIGYALKIACNAIEKINNM